MEPTIYLYGLIIGAIAHTAFVSLPRKNKILEKRIINLEKNLKIRNNMGDL